uniref:Tail length tape measure protein n=1 Tax=Myoviridae sp. cts9u10 TaxID=2825187 RepID=A0A8S5NZ55_9CAUD|nr:MAG TPA: tail length tape measure protein [Myoviridae sp. cts9u10]
MADDVIKESDLIQSDGSIDKITQSLELLIDSYGDMVAAIKKGSSEMVEAIKNMSTSTKEGRAALDDAARAAQRLERAQKEYEFAQTDIGKEVADLKSKTAALNRTTAESKKALELQAGSYERIRIHLKHLIDLYKNMSAEQRASRGDDIIRQINEQRSKLAAMDEQLKAHVVQISRVQKAEEKLAYLQSEEGQRYLELKAKIREVMAAHTANRTQVDALTQAQNRYNQAADATNIQIKELDLQTKILNQTAKYQAQINQSAEGSYNRLAAQYALNKIKLNAMSAAERSATDAGKKLEQETAAIYKEMIRLQEATGNHRLSVGNYAKSWDGLGVSVSQVVRELPAAAVSLNTFFLGISNNIPIVIDEIKKVREQNKALAAEGKPTVSVTKQIVSALFSWQTALVVVLYALSAHGKEILHWIQVMWSGQKTVADMADVVDSVDDALAKSTKSLGEQVATLRRLSLEWKNLGGNLKKQQQFIKDNQSEFNKLDVSINNVNQAENLLVDNTDVFIKALYARAKATAAMQVAAEYYGKAIENQFDFEQNWKDKPLHWWQKLAAGGITGLLGFNEERTNETYKHIRNKRKTQVEKEQEYNENFADKAVKIAENQYKFIDKIYKQLGLDTAHKKGSTRTRIPRERDLTDTIWRNDLTIQKKYEASITALQRDEFKKRKQEAVDSAEATIREMQEKFRKNEVFLAGKKGNKPLTDEQRRQVQKQQEELTAIIENTQRKLNLDLQDIEDERQIDSMTKLRQTMKFRYDTISAEIEKEKKLRLQQLDDREAAYTTKAATVSEDGQAEAEVTGQATPEQLAAWHKERAQIEAKYDQIILDLRAKEIQEQLYLVKKGTKEERRLLLEQIENARKLALAQNRAKPVEQQESETSINAKFNKQKLSVSGSNRLQNFQQQQALAKSEFDLAVHTADEIKDYELTQEIALWKEKIRLAKSGALDWSQAQIDEAHNVVKKLEEDQKKLRKKSLSLVGRIGKYGVTGFLLSYMGFDDNGIKAWNDACSQVISNLQEIAQAETDIAQAAVDAAEKRVEAAQSAYDAEVEGRNNGYANQVATKKKELQQEKKNMQEKQKLLEQAQKRQEAINTVTQASSLITASANIWSAMSGVPIIGPALALAAIATMWTSFAVAKVKAKQATAAANQEYGEGGLEFLEGGSHASGNDIDLHQKNSEGKNMRAEGGEAMAIINKRNTRKYRRVLPDIVDSLNKGTFENKFSQAFDKADSLQAQMITVQTTTDLSNIERGVEAIKKQNSERIYPLGDGRTLIIKGNVKRYINN